MDNNKNIIISGRKFEHFDKKNIHTCSLKFPVRKKPLYKYRGITFIRTACKSSEISLTIFSTAVRAVLNPGDKH
jgi:hypothetical protein